MIYNSIKNFYTTKIKAVGEVKGLNKWIYTSHGLGSLNIVINSPQIDL